MSDPELSRRLAEARAVAAAVIAERRRLHVAAEAAHQTSVTLIAHAVPDIGELSSTKGLSLCERLVGDELVVVPGLAWDEVPAPRRCPECAHSS